MWKMHCLTSDGFGVIWKKQALRCWVYAIKEFEAFFSSPPPQYWGQQPLICYFIYAAILYLAGCLCCFYNTKKIKIKRNVNDQYFFFAYETCHDVSLMTRLVYQLQEFIVNQRMEIYVKKSARMITLRHQTGFAFMDFLVFFSVAVTSTSFRAALATISGLCETERR